MRNGGAGEQFQRRVVQDALALHDAAVAVRHIFAQADVGEDEQVRVVALEGADGALHDAVVGIRAGRLFVFAFRQAEQQHGGDAERGDLLGFGAQGVNRELGHAGQRRDRAPLAALRRE